jgi:16S rRNA (adenine1518-N6/adenine1519-N6)-dimethyltransferase
MKFTRSKELIIRAKQYRAKKSLGQNFLVSENCLQAIVDSITTENPTNVLEIGPGLGFLTEELLREEFNVTAIDFDEEALSLLNLKGLNKIFADAVQFDFNTLPKPLIILGNLPFNVGTKILLNIIGEISDLDWVVTEVDEMVLMFQHEVAQRIVAKPNCKLYSPLSLVIQAKAEVEYLFKVPGDCFVPMPKVDGGVVRIKPKQNSRIASLNQKTRNTLKKLIKKAFSSRRKTLKNSLEGMVKMEDLKASNIDFMRRAETLSLDEFINLAERIEEVNCEENLT